MMGQTCAVHKHRDDVPLEDHHVWPLGEGGPNVKANRVRVCSNGHGEIHSFLDLLKVWQGNVPWVVRRRYGRSVRRVARLGYDRMQRRAM